jgi:hypothetical protein
MTQLTLMLVLLAGMLTLVDWRKGLVMCVVVGIAADPLRKLAPNQPVYYVVLVGVVFGAAWIRAALLRVPLGPSVIHGWSRNLKTPFSLFVALVIAQAMHSYVSYGSVVVPGIGLLVWLAPIPAVVLAYQFAVRRGLQGVRQWMAIYVCLALVALSGVYFEYSGVDWQTLGEIGEGQLIYDVGTVLKAHSGFFRASEIAAWHTAAVACFSFTLLLGKRPTFLRTAMVAGLVAMLVTLGILTGRRKMLMEITIFVATFFFLYAWIQRGAARLAVVIVAIGIAGYIGIVGFVSPDLVQASYTKTMKMENATRLEGYAVRGKSVFVDLPQRVRDVGIDPVLAAADAFGWLGAGLGTGSQGTNEIVAQHNIDRWTSEGGLGKIAMELGIPGLFLVGWLVFALGRHVVQLLFPLVRTSPQHARMAFGFLSFLIANAATFTIATQAYSDLFILLILGWTLGFLLAMPTLAARRIEQPLPAGFWPTVPSPRQTSVAQARWTAQRPSR